MFGGFMDENKLSVILSFIAFGCLGFVIGVQYPSFGWYQSTNKWSQEDEKYIEHFKSCQLEYYINQFEGALLRAETIIKDGMRRNGYSVEASGMIWFEGIDRAGDEYYGWWNQFKRKIGLQKPDKCDF